MSDNAFQSRPFPSYTTDDLRKFSDVGPNVENIRAEISRREAIEAGDFRDSYPSERLAYIRANPDRRFVKGPFGWVIMKD